MLREDNAKRKKALQVFKDLKSSSRDSSQIERAITVGDLHSPLYCTKTGFRENRFSGDTTVEVMFSNIKTSIVEIEDKISLIKLLTLLSLELYSPDFYGMLTSIGDDFINISNPYMLKHYMELVRDGLIDPEEPIFDSLYLYKFTSPLEINERRLIRLKEIDDNLFNGIENTNKHLYKLNIDISGDRVLVEEKYGGSEDFNVILPVHTCRFDMDFFPYYGLNVISVSRGEPKGFSVYPIHTPNIDVFQSFEVCTGQFIKVVPAFKANLVANFKSGYNESLIYGTFNTGYKEAIFLQLCRTRELLTLVFTDIEYENPITKIIEEQKNREEELKKQAQASLGDLLKEQEGSLELDCNKEQLLKDNLKAILPDFGFGSETFRMCSTYGGAKEYLDTQTIYGDALILLVVSSIVTPSIMELLLSLEETKLKKFFDFNISSIIREANKTPLGEQFEKRAKLIASMLNVRLMIKK